MGIPLSEYKRIFSRAGRPSGGDEGFELTAEDEAALDRAWTKVAEEERANQPTPPTP